MTVVTVIHRVEKLHVYVDSFIAIWKIYFPAVSGPSRLNANLEAYGAVRTCRHRVSLCPVANTSLSDTTGERRECKHNSLYTFIDFVRSPLPMELPCALNFHLK